MSEKIKSFTDLIAWKESHKLVLDVYRMTESFPGKERFGLIDQIRRAIVSVSSNIAEGFSRKSVKEKRQFYYMAIGSLTEFQNQLIISRDLKYIQNDEFLKIANQSVIVSKLINSLIKNINKIHS